MQTSTTARLLVWINRLVLALMVLAVVWSAWISLQNWHGIGV